MKETEIRNFVELHEVIDKYHAGTIIYRGINSTSYPLIPRVVHIVPPHSIQSREANKQEILRLFKDRAFQYLDFIPASNWEWDWLAIGQ